MWTPRLGVRCNAKESFQSLSSQRCLGCRFYSVSTLDNCEEMKRRRPPDKSNSASAPTRSAARLCRPRHRGMHVSGWHQLEARTYPSAVTSRAKCGQAVSKRTPFDCPNLRCASSAASDHTYRVCIPAHQRRKQSRSLGTGRPSRGQVGVAFCCKSKLVFADFCHVFSYVYDAVSLTVIMSGHIHMPTTRLRPACAWRWALKALPNFHKDSSQTIPKLWMHCKY